LLFMFILILWFVKIQNVAVQVMIVAVVATANIIKIILNIYE